MRSSALTGTKNAVLAYHVVCFAVRMCGRTVMPALTQGKRIFKNQQKENEL